MSRLPFPGHASPAAGFEAPFEMLEACHERVRRSLALMDKLIAHLREGRFDAQAAEAARDVLRYFDLAAPLHHEDEERHVFPAVEAALPDAVNQLRDDHRAMTVAWAQLRVPLATVAANPGIASEPGFIAGLQAAAAAHAGLYAQHLATEEGLVFPTARERVEDPAAMGAEMARRRQAPSPAGGRGRG